MITPQAWQDPCVPPPPTPAGDVYEPVVGLSVVQRPSSWEEERVQAPGTSCSCPRSGDGCEGRLRPGWSHPGGWHRCRAVKDHWWGWRLCHREPIWAASLSIICLRHSISSCSPPFGPAPSLSGPVLGLPCSCPGFRHHCINSTADPSTHSCFSASCFYLPVHTWPCCATYINIYT